jgi:Flp pilus assembly protein TadG
VIRFDAAKIPALVAQDRRGAGPLRQPPRVAVRLNDARLRPKLADALAGDARLPIPTIRRRIDLVPKSIVVGAQRHRLNGGPYSVRRLQGHFQGRSRTFVLRREYCRLGYCPTSQRIQMPQNRMLARPQSRGQSLAEFALIFPVFMLMLGGAIQFGIIFWGQNTLNQIIRDAGRFAVTQPTCDAGRAQEVADRIISLAQTTGVARVTAADITVTMPTNGQVIGGAPDPVSDQNGVSTPNFCPATTNSDHVWVRIAVNARVPIFFPFVPGNGSISSTALFRMEPSQP